MVAVEEVARVARPPLVATVLVVDDEEDLLDVAYAYLRSMGCSVLTAVDGEAALNVLESDQPLDLLLTDVAMPGAVSGPVLAEQAVLLRPGLKVVFCSGFPADALLEKMCGGGNFPLLRKPYRKADLEAVVRTALEGGPV
jgi:CheY-like chemotaxis protein